VCAKNSIIIVIFVIFGFLFWLLQLTFCNQLQLQQQQLLPLGFGRFGLENDEAELCASS